ncbi:DNA-directed RNA polymerase sigma-70 factor [Virgisporangium aliadipatigenens]|uniref:DNA-directed RNA polymerase sigma-70 factor n=1 Tax=Virgisporangium aliadipatigenens TaxID=741659 RepID=A0A8J3YH79_9ACTN|nr:RNA polymerase subunit sigma-70 [Virgisporangium aliadipatigenens]GIJ43970.1 DNA-directed RNA polymerase sigma-70 factor [Virgisporangium aliadipatigenens]
MSVEAGTDPLVAAARGGDAEAFRALVAPHLRALHLHSYRMLGSYFDAEEAVQETLLRAWRGFGGYEGRAPLLHWLYRITTTTCLKMIHKRSREPVTTTVDVAWLQPYPDALLDRLADHDADPAAVADRRESVALAFIVALQLLPGTQRAVLILREVLGWSAQQVAELLGTTVAAVNSALQRARATLAQAHGGLSPAGTSARPDDAEQRRVVAAFVRAWHARDIPALAALLRDDATLTMPPQAIEIIGRDAVVEFFATVPADGRLDLIRLVPIAANGHPALAAYLPDDTGDCRGYGIMVLTVQGDRIATVTGFPDPALYPVFDLPPAY